jgi:putative ABC transport system permease protein
MAGITFSILLIFMELGFLDTVKRSASLIYNYTDFDYIMVSYAYEYMNETGWFNRGYLIQAAVIPGVEKVIPMNMAVGKWEDPKTGIRSSIMILGLEQDLDFVKNPMIRQGLSKIDKAYSGIIDIMSHPSYGSLSVGGEAKVNRLDIHTTAQFDLGMGFYADGAIIVNNQTFASLTRRNPSKVRFGLIKALPESDLSLTKKKLKADLPSDVMIFDRQEIIKLEQNYFVSVMPIGIMVRSGVVVSFLVGAVILFQVLSTEISNRLNEFATLKAAGFTSGYIYGVGFQQAFLFSAISYVPALVLSYGLFEIVHKVTRLPILMTPVLAGMVFFLSLTMCLISGFLALRKVKKADPADLF